MLRSLILVAMFLCTGAFGEPPQTSGGTGSIGGTVTDPSDAVVGGATVEIDNRVTGFKRSATTDATGTFHIAGVPPNPYHLTATAPGFQTYQQDVAVRSTVPVELKIQLALASETTTVTVQGEATDLVENIPSPHTDIDQNMFAKLPTGSSASGLSDIITMAAPGVVADSNGFFHPLGEHADTAYSVDNQPITDQQSKQYSNQLPMNIFQSVEVVQGGIPPEYGGKTSLVVNAATRSGLGVTKPTGSLELDYGSFGSPSADFNVSFGRQKWGNFTDVTTTRSGRFLDSPEFSPLHDRGNSEKFFDRFDVQPTNDDTLHLNLFLARTWYQIPNTYDQQSTGQDQRQLIQTWNLSPGWTHLFSPSTSITVSPFARRDRVEYYPSRNPFADLPATISQDRTLTNAGVRADLSYVKHAHNVKIGGQWTHTLLDESFAFGITDPQFNAGDAMQPGLVPFDLTRGGRPFQFRGHADIKEEALYAQDSMTLGPLNITGGVRADWYRGLSSASAVQPRVGLSYLFKPTATVLRASYARLLETPYNENLVLSSSTGAGGLAAGAYGEQPLQPGRRNQFNAGLEQALGKLVVIDGDYFWKFTRNAFDFDTLFNTPITFPIEWRKAKTDGFALRVTLTDTHGFTAFTALGHTRARLYGPEVGGLIFNSPLNTGVFRVDHDQAFEQTTNLRYQYKKTGPWFAFTWRYDSGMVAGSVPDMQTALSFSGDEQAQIGLFCGNVFATPGAPIRSCSPAQFGTTRVRIPAPGTENDDTNPPRISPRHLFDISVGTDNLLHTDHPRWTLRLSVLNLTNQASLYNFLSTFSGTHFVAPRTYQASIGIAF